MIFGIDKDNASFFPNFFAVLTELLRLEDGLYHILPFFGFRRPFHPVKRPYVGHACHCCSPIRSKLSVAVLH